MVDLTDEPQAQRESFGKAPQAVAHRSDVSGGLLEVVGWDDSRRVIELEEQELAQRRLCAFDLGGEDGLLAHEGVEEGVWIGDPEDDAVESSERLVRTIEGVLDRRNSASGLSRAQPIAQPHIVNREQMRKLLITMRVTIHVR